MDLLFNFGKLIFDLLFNMDVGTWYFARWIYGLTWIFLFDMNLITI